MHWHELSEVENECTSYNVRLFAIFVPKIIRIGGNLRKLWQKQFCLFFSETRCSWWQSSRVPLMQCVQAHHPVGKWSHLAKESCSLQPVLVAKAQAINVKFGVHFVLLWYEVQSSISVEASASWNHDVWHKLGSLKHKAILVHLTLLPDSQNTLVWIVYRSVEMKVLLVSEKHLLCSCLWQTSKKFLAEFKTFLFDCVWDDLCWDMANAVRWRSCFAIRWTEEHWISVLQQSFECFYSFQAGFIVNKSVHLWSPTFSMFSTATSSA